MAATKNNNTIFMKANKILLAIAALAFGTFASCSDDTASIGSSIMPVQDSLSTFYETFPIETRSILTGPVVANTSSCYIGSFIDPDTKAITTSGFLAQFHLQEDYSLPKQDLVVKDDAGKIIADSCVLRIFHDKYYGDSLTTMKLTATDLSLDNVMEEGRTYYTDINPKDFVNPTPKVKTSTTYTVIDQNLSSAATDLSSGNYRSIPIHLGSDYGTYILQNYYDHPEYFKNSYTFIHNVCPGFYVEHTGGIGTIINSDVSALDVYFRYHDTDTTITKAWMRLAATQEVIQNTRIEHDNLESLFDAEGHAFDKAGKPFTYIKSPAGIHTELKLPINQISSGKHYNDTLNSARFTLRRYVAEEQNSNRLAPPPHILLIRKADIEDFFANKKLPDSKTSFLCEYNSSKSAYIFSNIAPLISYLRGLRDGEEGANVLPTDTPAEREAKWAAWEKENPDWATLVLLPVTADYTTVQSLYTSSKVLTAVRNDYNMRSVKLEGSLNGEIQLNVIYSRFEK